MAAAMLRRRQRGENAGVADEAAEDGIGDAGHGGEDGGGSDGDVADLEGGGHTGAGRHGVLDRVVPVFLHSDTDFDVGTAFREDFGFDAAELGRIEAKTLGSNGYFGGGRCLALS